MRFPWWVGLPCGVAAVRVGSTAARFCVNPNLDITNYFPEKGVKIMLTDQNPACPFGLEHGTGEGVAWGTYTDTIDKNGWSELQITTSSDDTVSNDVKMFAAGYLEGVLSYVRISEFYHNQRGLLLKDEKRHGSLSNIKSLFNQEMSFMNVKSNLIPHVMDTQPKDDYAKHIRYLVFQLHGLMDGYNYAARINGVHTLELIDMIALNSVAEWPTLMDAYTNQALRNRAAAGPIFLQKDSSKRRVSNSVQVDESIYGNATDPLSVRNWLKKASRGKCSAAVSLTDTDLLVGHTTFNDFSLMTRVMKYYNFNLGRAGTAASQIVMSSYPGCISSPDSFYVMDSGLVVADTSMELLNNVLFDEVRDFPDYPHVPDFMHVMAVNRVSNNAAQWAQQYQTGQLNPGLQNAQWLIVDYKLFDPGHGLDENTVWLLESVPGYLRSGDVSELLMEQKFLAGTNRPYYKAVRDASGYNDAVDSHGEMYSYSDNPRASIFREALGKGETNLATMRRVLHRNMFPNAGVQPSTPSFDIGARFDLETVEPVPAGAIDSKVVNYCFWKSMTVQGISGPSGRHPNDPPSVTIPAFQWEDGNGKEIWQGYPHVGQPNKFEFSWVQFTPGQNAPVDVSDSCAA